MKNDIGCYVSDLKVMQSNAGYYVGRDYWEKHILKLKCPIHAIPIISPPANRLITVCRS